MNTTNNALKMAMKDRNTLKEQFKKGSMPSEGAFENLIDSMVNKIDDGFSKNQKGSIGSDPNCESDENGKHKPGNKNESYYIEDTVQANGKWHVIIPKLNYCQAFEIVARTGIKNTGKHAVLHAIAVSAFGNSNSSIRKTRAWFDFWKPVVLQLRWSGSTHDYQLELRCKQNLGRNVLIKFFVRQLWSDEKMGIKKQFLDSDGQNLNQ